jgi:hypothetical protein
MKKNIDEEIKILDNRVQWILIIGAVVLIIVPILATQLNWFLDFTETGQIGDTIGGLTAPVIGAISALLIYFSFRAQINANRIIQKQINDQKTAELKQKSFDYQMERYRHLREQIDDFSFYLSVVNLKGDKALGNFIIETAHSYIRDIKINKDVIQFSRLRAILSFFNFNSQKY